MQLRQAQKSRSKLRIGLAGPSGSGKTYSALLMAHGMTKWEKICVIDTENQSADLYSDMGKYNVITIEAPFSPVRYTEAFKQAEAAGMEVIIVDSISHEWSGDGGCLQIQEKLGGRFQDWAKVTPMHERFKQAILQSPCHVITTVRSKTDYMMTNDGGKNKVQKVGLKQETREGFEYELTLSFDLNIKHLAEASKDRTGLFMDADPFTIDEKIGKKLLKWSNTGADPEKLIAEINQLAIQKGYSLAPALGYFKVNKLEDINYPNLLTIKTKLENMPEKPKNPEPKKPEGPIDPPGADQMPKGPIVDVDEVDAGITAMNAAKNPATDRSRAGAGFPDDDGVPVDETPTSDGGVTFSDKMATKGDVQMFKLAVARRAKQLNMTPENLETRFLTHLKAASLESITSTDIKKATDAIINLNTQFKQPAAPKQTTLEMAEEVFGTKAE